MYRMFCCFLLILLSNFVQAQSAGVTGKWRAIDDQTGKAVSIIEIYEKHNKIYGRITELLNSKAKNPKCDKCDGEDKGKPVLGLIVIKGLTKENEEYTNGKILDPKHGKLYKCSITLINKDKLKVRGYIGIELLGRTQFWERVK